MKIKLIFEAHISDNKGKKQLIPISIIESYQEPKTTSMRLGMAELKDDRDSFQLVVAHEYAHLVIENASRNAGSTRKDAESIEFWSKPIYEGVADLLASWALRSEFTAGRDNWSAQNLNEYSNLDQAKKAKDNTVEKARRAFKKMELIPKFSIYEDWLKKIEKYVSANGGSDPYAEGRWLAGSIRTAATTPEKQKKIADALVNMARSGVMENDISRFQKTLINKL